MVGLPFFFPTFVGGGTESPSRLISHSLQHGGFSLGKRCLRSKSQSENRSNKSSLYTIGRREVAMSDEDDMSEDRDLEEETDEESEEHVSEEIEEREEEKESETERESELKARQREGAQKTQSGKKPLRTKR